MTSVTSWHVVYLTWWCFYEPSWVWALPLPAIWVQAFPFLCHDSCFSHIHLLVSWGQAAPCLTKNNTDSSVNHDGKLVSKDDFYLLSLTTVSELYLMIQIKIKVWWNYRRLNYITSDFYLHLPSPKLFKIEIKLLLYLLFYMDVKPGLPYRGKNQQQNSEENIKT
jgi:hypothetical protein